MLMDFELHSVVNAKIAQLVSTSLENGVELDLVVTQTDKYHDTEYETVVIGLGSSKGMKSKEYFFNAIQNEQDNLFKVADKYYDEPVNYYERIGSSVGGGYISYRLEVQTISRIIKVFEVNYMYSKEQYEINAPVYTLIDTIALGDSKFSKKVLVK